jgi:Ca2+-binding RTX toxin-like protein
VLPKFLIEAGEPLDAVPEGKKMRRATAVLMVETLLLALAAGVALAAEVACSGGACTGTRNQDSITGTDTTDEILALGGKDFMDVRGGADEVHGSEGGDRLFGDNKNDRALDGPDEVYGGASIDDLFGLGGSDLLDGGPDDDFIFAQEFSPVVGTDTVRAGEGDDEIFADDGASDSISCGAGRDEVVFDAMLDSVADDCETRNNKRHSLLARDEMYSATSQPARPLLGVAAGDDLVEDLPRMV